MKKRDELMHKEKMDVAASLHAQASHMAATAFQVGHKPYLRLWCKCYGRFYVIFRFNGYLRLFLAGYSEHQTLYRPQSKI